ncbi:MAG: RsmD family RNA methyltransferase [Saprospiraceae bacterium]|nr:RsmD family RNA methyltransferase [Saprospiraceae bacterium]
MRIIGGKFKGRKFYPPADKWPTRPTTDYAKEGLFNILNNRLDFEEVKILDLFGGTGSHSYEFISRGCKNVTYVDKFYGCVNFVQKISKELNIESQLHIVKSDVFSFIHKNVGQYDYIFAGPPYPLKEIDKIPDLIFENNMLLEEGFFVLEHDNTHNFSEHPHFVEVRNYSKTLFSFFA